MTSRFRVYGSPVPANSCRILLRLSSIALSAAALLAISPTSLAQPTPNSVIEYVLPASQASLEIPCSAISSCGPASAQSSSNTKAPDHGTLEIGEDSWRYIPDEGFWSVGTDSFIVVPDASESVTVQILAGRHQDVFASLDFETGQSGLAQWQIIGFPSRLVTSPVAAIHGNFGLQVSLDEPEDVGFSIVAPSIEGGYPTGSSAIIVIDICNATANTAFESATMLRAVDPSGDSLYELRYAPLEQRIWTVAFSQGQEAWVSDSLYLGPGAHDIDLDWWAASNSSLDDGGLMFLVDDMLVGRIETLTNFGDSFLELSAGNFDSATGIGGTYHLDSYSAATGGIGPRVETFLTDGFEEDLSRWTSIYDPTNQIGVSTTGAMTGASSLNFRLKGTESAWVQSEEPTGQRSFGIRFTMNSGYVSGRTSTPISTAFLGVANDALSNHHLLLRARFITQAKGYEIQLAIRVDPASPTPNAWRTTPWHVLSFARHSIEVQFIGALDDTSQDGVARLWIDGEVVGEIANLDNDTKRLGMMRLGVFNRSLALDGGLTIDNFESWGR